MWLDFIVNKVLFWLLVCMILLEIYNVVFHRGIPNIRTAPAIRKKIIDLLKEDFEQKGCRPYTVVDLGSGHGLFTREIAKALPDAQVIGIEVAWLSVVWSNILKHRDRLPNLKYVRQNFLTYHFSDVDAVVMYLLPSMMWNLSKKLYDETRPNTLIISNKFPLKEGWEAIQTEQVKTLYLHQGDLYIYRKP